MAYYSERHYDLVSPPPDTAEAMAERLRYRDAAKLGVADRELKYPELTGVNAAEAISYQQQRILWHYEHPRS